LFYPLYFHEFLGENPYAAWKLAGENLDHHARTGDRRLLSISHLFRGESTRWLGSPADAVRHLRACLAMVPELGAATTFDFPSQYLARLLAEHGADGELEEAWALAQPVVERVRYGSVHRSLALTSLALLELRAGSLAVALGLAREARAIARTLGLRGQFPLIDGTLL